MNLPAPLRTWTLHAAVAIALVAATSMALAEPPLLAPDAAAWTVTSNFEKNSKDDLNRQPRMNLSGAACVPTTPKFTSCLIANDEKKYAQFFSIQGTSLTPGKLIRLSDADNDPDAEGVAYADGYFYVTGSHGRSRASDQASIDRYAVFRLAVDPVTGTPRFKVTENAVVGVDVTTRLRAAIRTAPVIKDYYNKPLDESGVNIEGIAVKAGRMHFGLRAPSTPDGKAYILSVGAAALFTQDQGLSSGVTALPLGRDTGIRDLAAVRDGILILAGSSREEAVPASVWLWDGTSANATKLATLDLSGVSKSGKAEILLPLSEDAGSYRVLVMFDGIENGGPLSFTIPR